MPWVCNACQESVGEDDLVCPACSAPKSAWTMVVDRTRTFRMSKARVRIVRGRGEEAPEAEVIVPVAKADVEVEAPADGRLVTVRLRPGKAAPEVTLVVDYEEDESAELGPFAPLETDDESEWVEVPFLFVFGEGATPPVDGVHVVDISEGARFAPAVEVTALRKKPKVLPAAVVGNARWSREQARVGESVELLVDIARRGGTPVRFGIEEHDADGQHDAVAVVEGSVEGGVARARWTFVDTDDADDVQTARERERGYTAPEYRFEVEVEGQRGRSGLLTYQHWLELDLRGADGEAPLAGVTVYVVCADGAVAEALTDEEGVARFEGLPPGEAWFSLVDPREAEEEEAEEDEPAEDDELLSPDDDEDDAEADDPELSAVLSAVVVEGLS